MTPRIKNIRSNLKEENLDCLLVTSSANIMYLTGYKGRDSYLLISPKANFYFTDGRYAQEAVVYLKGKAKIKKIDGSVFDSIAKECHNLKARRIGVEEQIFPFASFLKLKKALGARTHLVPAGGMIERLRQVKSLDEVRRIKEAIRITQKALNFAKKILKTGRKEIEIVGELERFIRSEGAQGGAFEIIVASGPNSSYPHHIPSERKLLKNELVLIDIGVDFKGYKSDLTRVFFLGKITILAQQVEQIVLEAQKRAIKTIRAGIQVKEVDAAAREYIARKGFGDCFNHSLGHGFGLEVHEGPRLGPNDQTILKVGMILTVEPAIYIPKKFGIRIEDDILVTKKGCEVLSGALNQ